MDYIIKPSLNKVVERDAAEKYIHQLTYRVFRLW